MGIKRSMVNGCIGMIISLFRVLSRKERELALALLAHRCVPETCIDTVYGQIKFFSFGEIPWWRANYLLTKEPETIMWIDGMKKGSVFWDIGANVGCYTLYAAKKGLEVMAFEPSGMNYFLLCRNIGLNRLDESVQALCVAFDECTKLGRMNISSDQAGAAFARFGERVREVSDGKGSLGVIFAHSTVGYAIDDFITRYKPPFPNYIKIDVDGTEDRIIMGAEKTLSDIRMRSLLVECDEGAKSLPAVIRMLEKCGLRLSENSRSQTFIKGQSSVFCNYIFSREQDA
jgi:FkbM family methyltransferase